MTPEERMRAREAGRTETPRPRTKASAKAAAAPPDISALGIVWRLAAVAVALGGVWLAFFQTEKFLIRDERFLMPENGSPFVEGVRYAPARKIREVFAQDLGRSIYLLPMAKRRQALLGIDWVRDASIVRLWPNRVLVRVSERQPVAFLVLPSRKMALVDADGVILEAPPQAPFTLPVLAGTRPTDPLSLRRERVRRMDRLMRDLGPRGDKISEVDASDQDNIKATYPFGDHLVALYLGDRNYAERMQNFLDHANEIRKKAPGAKTIDLRLEDKITAVDN